MLTKLAHSSIEPIEFIGGRLVITGIFQFCVAVELIVRLWIDICLSFSQVAKLAVKRRM